MQQVAGKLVKGTCPAQSPSGLFRGQVGGHIEMDHATPVMANTTSTQGIAHAWGDDVIRHGTSQGQRPIAVISEICYPYSQQCTGPAGA
jgi:hypothetical protein